ncbi:MAG: FliM/FliN family flagellar motor switch protein [Planctomycetota bacterium]|jgi:flagellar motor switch protein FliM
MSTARNNDLSKKKIQQILAALGSRPIMEDTTQTEAAEYNWYQPHCFTRSQLHMLDDFTKKTAKTIARKFATLCHGDFTVTIVSTTQHFANELLDQAFESKQNDYYLAFGTDEIHPCGLISVPLKTAFIWTTQLLGDTESKEDSRSDLSQLEESLLLDLGSTVIEALSDSHSNCDFQPAKNIVRRLLPLELKGTEELCKITFNVKKSDSENTEAHLLILCKDLEPVVGRTAQVTDKFSAEDISNAILNHLQQMSVFVTAQLASTVVTFDELMSLRVDDILLLDKAIDKPVEVMVNDQMAFHGKPAKSASRYAVLITERIGGGEITQGRL